MLAEVGDGEGEGGVEGLPDGRDCLLLLSANAPTVLTEAMLATLEHAVPSRLQVSENPQPDIDMSDAD